jgi:hypothetical protein
MKITQIEEFDSKAAFNAWLKTMDEDRIKKVYRSADKVYFVWYKI